MKIKYKYAVYKEDMLYDYFNTLKEAERFIDELPSIESEHYYWYVKKVRI